VRRLPEGHEHDRVEAELPVRLLRQYEMTDVRRVESPTEDPEPSARYGRLIIRKRIGARLLRPVPAGDHFRRQSRTK
jgi:hypothetical protein